MFISKNADAVSNVAGADGSSVTFTRLDTLDPNSRDRFISSIYVDPRNPNHAWISYSGYSARTPFQPGHVFSVTYDPDGRSVSAFAACEGKCRSSSGELMAHQNFVP